MSETPPSGLNGWRLRFSQLWHLVKGNAAWELIKYAAALVGNGLLWLRHAPGWQIGLPAALIVAAFAVKGGLKSVAGKRISSGLVIAALVVSVAFIFFTQKAPESTETRQATAAQNIAAVNASNSSGSPMIQASHASTVNLTNSSQSINVQPGAVASFGQIGGITAQTVNQIVITNPANQFPVGISMTYDATNQPEGSHFVTKVIFHIKAQFVLPSLLIVVHGSHVQTVGTWSGNWSMSGSYSNGFTKDGLHYLLFNQPQPTLGIIVTTAEPEALRFEVGINP